MNSDGRERPNLSASLVHKLKLCGLQFGLSEDAGSLAIIERLADDYLWSGDSAEPPVKKVRGSTTGAERDSFSDATLSHLGWSVAELKHRKFLVNDLDRMGEALASILPAIRQLILLVSDTPRSPESLSRIDVVALLVEGMAEFESRLYDTLKTELSAVDFMARKFFETLSAQGELADLSSQFKAQYPQLEFIYGADC
jgi:hypothetical protein